MYRLDPGTNQKALSPRPWIASPIGALLALMAFVLCSAANAVNYPPNAGVVNNEEIPYSESLRKFVERHGEPRLEKLTDRVHVARAYDFINFTFIEGETGIIVVDAGHHREAVERALKDYREQVSKKPIIAVFYSHGHDDHTGGIRGLVPEGQEDKVDIYQSSLYTEYGEARLRPTFISDMMRAEMQFNVDRVYDNKDIATQFGVWPHSWAKTIDWVPPNKVIDATGNKEHELVIDGVRIIAKAIPGECIDNLLVWLPDDKVMFANDNIGDSFGPLFTPRLPTDRDPQGLVRIHEYMMSKPIDHLVLGHGNTIIGDPEKAHLFIKDSRDAFRTMLDQISYYANLGYSADETAEAFRMPKHLQKERTVDHHHRYAWHARQGHARVVGWFSSNPRDMIKPHPTDEAKGIIKLAGGEENVLKAAQKALKDGDNGWAVKLADYLLKVDYKTDEALKIQIQGFRAQAGISNSGVEHNYYLARAKMLEGDYRYGGFKYLFGPQRALDVPSPVLIDALVARFDMAKGEFESIPVNIEVTDNDQVDVFGVHMDRGILHRGPEALEKVDATIHIDRFQLVQVVAGEAKIDDLGITIEGDKDRAIQLFRILGL